jgi:hypothetical protein
MTSHTEGCGPGVMEAEIMAGGASSCLDLSDQDLSDQDSSGNALSQSAVCPHSFCVLCENRGVPGGPFNRADVGWVTERNKRGSQWDQHELLLKRLAVRKIET